MNWYKKAKIFDAYEDLYFYNPVICTECKRWLTEDSDGNATWKEFAAMTDDEQQYVNEYRSQFSSGKCRIKTEICEDCQEEIQQRLSQLPRLKAEACKVTYNEHD